MLIEPRAPPMIADGPAIVAAPSAPNSQPEPMIDVSDAHRSPRKPTPRSSPSASSAADCGPLGGVTTSAMNPPQDPRECAAMLSTTPAPCPWRLNEEGRIAP